MLTTKYRTAIAVGTILFASLIIYFGNEYRKSKELILRYEEEKKVIDQKFEILDYELALKKASFGKRLTLDDRQIRPLTQNSPPPNSFPIVVVVAPEYFEYGGKSLFNLFNSKHDMCMGIVISTPDSSFGARISSEIVDRVPTYVDLKLQYSQLFNLAENESVVILKTKDNTVIYSYIIEPGNNLKDVEQAEIILNFLKRSGIKDAK